MYMPNFICIPVFALAVLLVTRIIGLPLSSHLHNTSSSGTMWLRSLIKLSLFPTIHLVTAVHEFRDRGVLEGSTDRFTFPVRLIAYVTTTATNDGLQESKLMWYRKGV
jgi:hypothetical protein